MIRRKEKLDIKTDFNFELIAPKERIVFFDIETTGLSSKNASIYLIGTVSYEEGAWQLTQLFAESMAEEAELIRTFFELIAAKKKLGRVILISYNGDGFDIPFIKGCIASYRLPCSFDDTVSLDLIKKIRPYKRFAGLSGCSLKTVERELCGINREDKYNGGELIYVYEEYLRLAAIDRSSCEYTELNMKLKDRLLYALLLHNAEDIADMPLIMDILGYEGLFNGEFTVYESRIKENSSEAKGLVWDIHASLKTPLPKGFYLEEDGLTLSISEENRLELNLAAKLYEGELKYFFADYKEYYYLPAEDYAIHKSVGEFVVKSARRQATARTCYQRRSGLFVPEYEPVLAPMFYKDYKTSPAYGDIKRELEKNEGCIDIDLSKSYIMSVLNKLRE